jgi:hypothetical protein
MSRRVGRCVVAFSASLLGVWLMLAGMDLWAQSKGDKKKAAGRLPAYYGQVITDKQRDAIYTIWNKYDADIDRLEAQIKDMKTKRDAEIDDLLTDEQKARIKQLRDEEKARDEANKKAKETAKGK